MANRRVNDHGADLVDAQLDGLEKKLARLYSNATDEIETKLKGYFNDYAKQEAEFLKLIKEGKKTEAEFKKWRAQTISEQERWVAMRERLAQDLAHADAIAVDMINENSVGAYSTSYNFGAFMMEQESAINGIDLNPFTIYNEEAVKTLMKDDPDLLPSLTVDNDYAVKWNRQHIQSAVAQGIVQGDSMEEIAGRLRNVTTMDYNQSIRNARTATNGAENAGRMAVAERCVEQGVEMIKEWNATLDDRTRDSHLLLDGQQVEEDQPFSNGLMYAGDPSGAPEEVYNCRCATRHFIKGIDHSHDDELYEQFMQEKHYDEWLSRKMKEEDPSTGAYQKAQLRAEAIERQAKLRKEAEEKIKELEVKEIQRQKEDSALSIRRETDIITGSDISETWTRRKNDFDYEIDDVIDAQGFNGLPRILPEEEFNKAVEESGFIAQRTYSAPNQEVLDAYRDQLYNGDFYVNCETGGAQYGQGLYCAADYNGQLTEGIKAEMDHYQALGDSRFGRRYTDEERLEMAISNLPEELRNNPAAINYIKADSAFDFKGMAENESQLSRAEYNEVHKAIQDVPLNKPADTYTETLTLDPSAKIVKYDDLQKDFKDWKLDAGARAERNIIEQYADKGEDFVTALKYESLDGGVTYNEAKEARARLSEAEVAQVDQAVTQMHDAWKAADTEAKDFNIGSYATLKGYDAINAEGHGESGSYTVILNRSKIIFKEDK